MRILTQKDFKTSNWSGGTTTELFIFPQESNYQERNFDFRISTATVEIEKSDFTPLPGFHRILMILEGKLKIQHLNQYDKTLETFDTDHFRGDWITSSEGIVTDFNLIMKPEYEGLINTHKNQFKIEIDNQETTDTFNALYLVKNEVTIDGIVYPEKTLIVLSNSSTTNQIVSYQNDTILLEIQIIKLNGDKK